MSTRRWIRCRIWLVLATWTLTGCASLSPPPQPTDFNHEVQANAPEWQGRLRLRIQTDPPSSMSAGFLLRGQAKQGHLDFYSPLGTTWAALRWSPSAVQLQQGGHIQRFDSMDDLTEQATGAALPIYALFDWLNGTPSVVTGWQADLSQLSKGLLTAQRTSPMPIVQLHIKLD